MIVRDGAAHLPACLASVRPFVDEIVVADTGSSDRSIEIARQFDKTPQEVAKHINRVYIDSYSQ